MARELASCNEDRQWFILSRWQEYEGEGRVNLLRIGAIGAFYIVQLVSYYGFDRAAESSLPFHRAVTALAVAWTLIALAIMLCLRNRIFPGSLKFISTGCDIVLLTALAAISEAKANSPLVYVYFVILLFAGLRFSLRLVWCATIGCMVAYLALVAISDPTWFDPEHTVRPVEQLIVHLSLAICGIVLWQIIRRVKRLADDYLRRVNEAKVTHETS